jgi:probable HAF family extracellular repeat protein
MVSMNPSPGTAAFAAFATSADGLIVAGSGGIASLSQTHAVRWTAAGLQDLGTLASGSFSFARGISADGTVVVGTSTSSGSSVYRAFRWTAATGMVDLGVLQGGTAAYASSVSDDGSVVVGYCSVPSGDVAFRWTLSGGMVSLGALPGDAGSYAHRVSGDGMSVVGVSVPASGESHPFLWTAAGGMVDLNTLLPTLGSDLSGWTLTAAYGISADGRTIAGTGDHNGTTEAWVATLTGDFLPGACCLGATCRAVTSNVCAGAGGTFAGHVACNALGNSTAPCCRTDYNHVGGLTVGDIFDFLNDWFAGNPTADFNGCGLAVQDIFDFLNAWFAGC